MKPFISHIFEGDFPISQRFGERPEVYSRFNMKGHNGVDFALPVGTKLLFGCRIRLTDIRVDQKGFGMMVRGICDGIDEDYELTWAHLSEFDKSIAPGMTFEKQDGPGLSGNTGFSSGPHLHFQVRVLGNGGIVKNYDNGFKGAIDPLPLFDLSL